jgi:hypothetical protein
LPQQEKQDMPEPPLLPQVPQEEVQTSIPAEQTKN